MGIKAALKRLAGNHDPETTPPSSPRTKGSPRSRPTSWGDYEPKSPVVPSPRNSIDYEGRPLKPSNAFPKATARRNSLPPLPSTVHEKDDPLDNEEGKTGLGIGGGGADKENVKKQGIDDSAYEKVREVLSCDHHGHKDRLKDHWEIKEGQKVEHRQILLKPVIHENHHYHEVEEIHKIIDRDIHTHEVCLSELPIYRPRRIVTRARIVVETEVMPEPRLGDDEASIRANDHIWTTDKKELLGTDLTTKGVEEPHCDEEGAYQAYAQQVHDRACEMLAEYVNKQMALFEKSLVTSPIPLATAPLLPQFDSKIPLAV